MASGDVLARWSAADGVPPTASFAPLVRRNKDLVAAFDAAADEILYFFDLLRGYAGGGVTLRIAWAAATATSGNCIWTAAFERRADDAQDIDGDSFASANSVTAAAPNVAGELSYDEIAFTDGAQMDSLAVGEHFCLQLTRDADNGADTMAGDAHLVALELRET